MAKASDLPAAACRVGDGDLGGGGCRNLHVVQLHHQVHDVCGRRHLCRDVRSVMAAGDLMLMTRPVSSPSVSRAVPRQVLRQAFPAVRRGHHEASGVRDVGGHVDGDRLGFGGCQADSRCDEAAAAAARAYFFRDMEMLRDRWMDTMGYDARTKTQPPAGRLANPVGTLRKGRWADDQRRESMLRRSSPSLRS